MEQVNKDLKLSEAEIEQLFRFTAKKFVHWYDLQIEMVDHLASQIENELQADASLSFEAALNKVYKSFGIFGFSQIVRERQNQLAQSAKKRWWSELRCLFGWPRILLILLIVSAVYTLSLSVNPGILSSLFLAIYFLVSVLFFGYVIRDVRLQKRLLLLQSGSTYVALPFSFEFVVAFMYMDLSPLAFTLLLTLGILIKLTSFVLYRKIRTEAEALFPQVFAK